MEQEVQALKDAVKMLQDEIKQLKEGELLEEATEALRLPDVYAAPLPSLAYVSHYDITAPSLPRIRIETATHVEVELSYRQQQQPNECQSPFSPHVKFPSIQTSTCLAPPEKKFNGPSQTLKQELLPPPHNRLSDRDVTSLLHKRLKQPVPKKLVLPQIHEPPVVPHPSLVDNPVTSFPKSMHILYHDQAAQTGKAFEEEIATLKEELAELKDKTEKMETSVAEKGRNGKDRDDVQRQESGVMITAAAGGVKGLPTPAGMTPEQLQEFKKQTLQINALQQRLKDLEAKLTDTMRDVKKGNEKSNEMEDKENEDVKDIYKVIEQINNSLSEKISQQKVEVQKIAGDQPKPINYDPFNYGEAYGGDLVDFQSRKRIHEIKLLLQSLQAAMLQMRDSVKVSPNIDLGYKVVRLDQLVSATGFGQAVNKGEVTQEDAMVIQQSTSREPGKVEYPRKEMFQTSAEQQSQWAITDTIMQTMYRLEMELGELQKGIGTHDISVVQKNVEELQQALKQLKDRQMDSRTIKRIIDESAPAKRDRASDAARLLASSPINAGNFVTKNKFEDGMKSFQMAIDGVNKRIAHMEGEIGARPASATSKRRSVPMDSACLSCDRSVSRKQTGSPGDSLPEMSAFSPTINPRTSIPSRSPPRFRQMLNRGYKIDINNETVDVYSIPRPCGAGYYSYWPKVGRPTDPSYKPKEPMMQDMKCSYIRGIDGQIYIANRDAVTWDVCKGRAPMSAMEATTFVRNQPESGAHKMTTSTVFKGNQFVTTIQAEQAHPKKAIMMGGVYVQGQPPIPGPGVIPTSQQEGFEVSTGQQQEVDIPTGQQEGPEQVLVLGTSDTLPDAAAEPGAPEDASQGPPPQAIDNNDFFTADEGRRSSQDPGVSKVEEFDQGDENENAVLSSYGWMMPEGDQNTNAHDRDMRPESRFRKLDLMGFQSMADQIIDLVKDPEDGSATLSNVHSPVMIKWASDPVPAKAKETLKPASSKKSSISTGIYNKRDRFAQTQKPTETRHPVSDAIVPRGILSKSNTDMNGPTKKFRHHTRKRTNESAHHTWSDRRKKTETRKLARSRKQHKRSHARCGQTSARKNKKTNVQRTSHKEKVRLIQQRKMQREQRRLLLQRIEEREKRYERQKQEIQQLAQVKKNLQEQRNRERFQEAVRKRELYQQQLEKQRFRKSHNEQDQKIQRVEEKVAEMRQSLQNINLKSSDVGRELERHSKLKSICHWLDQDATESDKRQLPGAGDATGMCIVGKSARNTNVFRIGAPTEAPPCSRYNRAQTRVKDEPRMSTNSNSSNVHSVGTRKVSKKTRSIEHSRPRKTEPTWSKLGHDERTEELPPPVPEIFLNIDPEDVERSFGSVSPLGSEVSLIGPAVSVSSFVDEIRKTNESSSEYENQVPGRHMKLKIQRQGCPFSKAPPNRHYSFRETQPNYQLAMANMDMKNQFYSDASMSNNHPELSRHYYRTANLCVPNEWADDNIDSCAQQCYGFNTISNRLQQENQRRFLYGNYGNGPFMHQPKPPTFPPRGPRSRRPRPTFRVSNQFDQQQMALTNQLVPSRNKCLPLRDPALLQLQQNQKAIKGSLQAARNYTTRSNLPFASQGGLIGHTMHLSNPKRNTRPQTCAYGYHSSANLGIYGKNGIVHTKNKLGGVSNPLGYPTSCAIIVMQWNTPAANPPAGRSCAVVDTCTKRRY